MSDKKQEIIQEQAKILAAESKKAEPGIAKIYWFPDDSEVRLIELDDEMVTSLSGEVEPFYFDPSPEDNVTVPSGIAIIRSDEYGKLTLPEGWGDWIDGQELDVTA